MKIEFIEALKSSTNTFIVLNGKPDNSFYLYINYQGLY